MLKTDLIKQLLAEASRHDVAAHKLRDAAAVLGESSENGKAQNENGVMLGGTRVEQIQAFLAEHGPSTRGQIRRGLPHIPRGTIAAILNVERFDRDESGKWSAKSGE